MTTQRRQVSVRTLSRVLSRILAVTGAAALASCSGGGPGATGSVTTVPFPSTVTDAVFFGDSLTDAGTTGIRFTTEPGRIWSQIVAENLGQTDTPATQGGANYAVGGAKVASAGPEPITAQLDTYLTDHRQFTGDQLVTVFAGTNDVLAGGTGGAAEADTADAAAVDAELDTVDRILGAGAGHVLVFTLFDLALTPAFGGTDTASHLTVHDRTLDYNRRLLDGLAQRHPGDARVGVLDTFALVNGFVSDPGKYGFAHGAGEDACATPGASRCDRNSLVAPDADRTYIFAGGVHLTTRTNELLATAVENRVEELWGGQ